METIAVVPVWSHARWYLDVKQSEAQRGEYAPSQGVALRELSPVVGTAGIQQSRVGFRG